MNLTLPSAKEAIVLDLLQEHGALYGLQLVTLSGDALKRGTVYVTLARMEEKGLIRSKQDKSPDSHAGMPRPRYTITALGQRAHDAYRAAFNALHPQRSRA